MPESRLPADMESHDLTYWGTLALPMLLTSCQANLVRTWNYHRVGVVWLLGMQRPLERNTGSSFGSSCWGVAGCRSNSRPSSIRKV